MHHETQANLNVKLAELLLHHQEGPVSGEELASRLGVTRAAVWKEMEKLRSQGYEIRSAPRRGYQLACFPDVMSREVISFLLPEQRQGALVVLPEVDSTNTYAQRMILDGAGHGAVVAAEQQTQGAGRMGRTFISPPGGVYLSMILEPDCGARALSLLTSFAGLAVCRAIREVCDQEPRLKWPNDVILEGKKVCGILTKLVTDAENNRITHAVVGIGVNVGQENFPPQLRSKAVSLRQLGSGVPRPVMAAALIRQLDRIFTQERWLDDPGPDKVEQLKALSCTLGARVTIVSPLGQEEGEALDIDPEGGLVVRVNGRLKTITSGEVSVRGMLGYL